MKAVVYSLFGYNNKAENCFDFDSYLTGMMLNIRFNRLVYPGWDFVVEIDKVSYQAFQPLFDYLRGKDIIKMEVNKDSAPLCESMLWRMKPAYWRSQSGMSIYSHVLCRDLDSLCTYREAQAVQIWINNDKTVHAITDSVSHDVFLMGGMIGINCGHFTHRTSTQSFNDLMNLCKIDLTKKGSDQTFLNQTIYPMVGEKGADSITQHYYKGIGRTFLGDYHTCRCWEDGWATGHKEGCKENVKLDIPDEMRETDGIVEHIGASGWNQLITMRLLDRYKDKFQDLIEIEKKYKQIFSWIK